MGSKEGFGWFSIPASHPFYVTSTRGCSKAPSAAMESSWGCTAQTSEEERTELWPSVPGLRKPLLFM